MKARAFIGLYKVAGGGCRRVILMPATSFTFDGQYAFLTYPRSGELSRERLRDVAVGSWSVDKFLIARELHADGEPHLHAVLYWKERYRRVGATCFDVDGHHPNIQKPGNLKATCTYVCKDDDTPLESEPPIRNMERSSNWGRLLSESSDAASFLLGVKQCYPRDYVISNKQLRDFAAGEFETGETTYTGPGRDTFRELDGMTEWVNNYVRQTGIYNHPTLRLPPPLPLTPNPRCE